MSYFCVIAFSILFLLPPAVFGAEQIDLQCHKALIESHTFAKDQFSLQIAYMELINRTNYDEVKRDIGATAFMPSGLFSGDFDDFEVKRINYLSNRDLRLSLNQSKTYIQSSLGKEAAMAYLGCLEKQSLLFSGIHVWAEDVRKDELDIVVAWRPGEGDDKARLNLEITGGTVGPYQKVWKTKDTKTYTVKRDKGRDTGVKANVDLLGPGAGGYTDSLNVAAYLIYERPAQLWKSKTRRQQCPGSRNCPERYCEFSPPPDWLFDPATAMFQFIENNDDLGPPANEGKMLEKKGKYLCMFIHARGIDRNSTATVSGYMEAQIYRFKVETPDRLGLNDKPNEHINWSFNPVQGEMPLNLH